LVDITPPLDPSARIYPFIEAKLSDEDFFAITDFTVRGEPQIPLSAVSEASPRKARSDGDNPRRGRGCRAFPGI